MCDDHNTQSYVHPRKNLWNTMCCLHELKLCRFQPLVSQKLSSWFPPNLYITCSTYTPPLIPNVKEIALSVCEIFTLKNNLIFFLLIFFCSLHQKINFKSCKSIVFMLWFPSNLVHIWSYKRPTHPVNRYWWNEVYAIFVQNLLSRLPNRSSIDVLYMALKLLSGIKSRQF